MDKNKIIDCFIGDNRSRIANRDLLDRLYKSLATPEIESQSSGSKIIAKHLCSGYFMTYDLATGDGPHIESSEELARASSLWVERPGKPKPSKKGRKRAAK
jgi:hypothetical protein